MVELVAEGGVSGVWAQRSRPRNVVYLRARFHELWERLGARGDVESVFDDLVARYREHHRRYHSETHLEFGLGQLDLLAGTAPHPDLVEFAFYYHDGVYEIGAADNEERSAGLAIGTLKKARVPGHIQSLVGGYIMVTKPGQEPSTADQRVMADIDLAILGQERPVFVEYERQVREEYADVPEETFWRQRKKILRAFLWRPSVYHTNRFRELYDTRARENLTWTIANH
jgi:predicted metal-dependent HD superfamily phosphohydrolase